MSQDPDSPSRFSHLGDGATRAQSHVTYRLEVEELEDTFVVHAFHGVEELNRPYLFKVDVSAVEDGTDCAELLGHNVQLIIARGEHTRQFAGIVSRVTIEDDGMLRQTSRLEIRPALYALRLTKNSRIFQEKDALEIIQNVLGDGLAVYGRQFDVSALDEGRYHNRDYCVQYQESDFDFVHRLMEEEGIGYYFEYETQERLVFFDENRQLTAVQTMDGGPIRFDYVNQNVVDAEPILRFRPCEALQSTAVRVRDYDWTSSSPRVEGDADTDEKRPRERSHEVYEHGYGRHATISEDNELLATMLSLVEDVAFPKVLPFGWDDFVHDIPGARLEGFTSHNADFQSRVRHELLRRDARVGTGISLVTGFAPGRTFDLMGHATLGADGDYVITRVTHSSGAFSDAEEKEADNGSEANYHNRFECIPKAVAWRPQRITPRPQISGIQTAKVTGPMGMNIHTDQHGRIKIKFDWDRRGEDPLGNYTCWVRVSQTWAGDEFPGFMFIPRIGMEVIVSFLDGNPDRPLVTGCVYNGNNSTVNMLPFQATKSMIKTRSVPHGPGYNELSFEDAMGKERVHLRAQRDLDELVLNDHYTRVNRDERNYVGRNQYEAVMARQDIQVGADRTVSVQGDERHAVHGAQHVHVGSTAVLDVQGSLLQHIATGSASTHVEQGSWVAQAGGASIHISDDRIQLAVGESSILLTPNGIHVNQKTYPAASGSSASSSSNATQGTAGTGNPTGGAAPSGGAPGGGMPGGGMPGGGMPGGGMPGGGMPGGGMPNLPTNGSGVPGMPNVPGGAMPGMPNVPGGGVPGIPNVPGGGGGIPGVNPAGGAPGNPLGGQPSQVLPHLVEEIRRHSED